MSEDVFYIRSRGKVSGPFDQAGLQRLVRLGMLSRAHEVSHDKLNWEPVAGMAGIFPETAPIGMGVATVESDTTATELPSKHVPVEADPDPEGQATQTGLRSAVDDPIPPTSPVTKLAALNPDTATCSSCGGIFPAAQIFLDRGRKLCLACYQKQPNTVGTAASPSAYRGMAITALVLGICGMVIPFLGLISAILATIFGGVALNGNRRTGTRDGSGMATAGLILGVIAIALYLAGLIYFVVVLAEIHALPR